MHARNHYHSKFDHKGYAARKDWLVIVMIIAIIIIIILHIDLRCDENKRMFN